MFSRRQEYLLQKSEFLKSFPNKPLTAEEINRYITNELIFFYYTKPDFETSNDFWNFIEMSKKLHFLMIPLVHVPLFKTTFWKIDPDIIKRDFVCDPARFDNYSAALLDEIMVYKREIIPEHLQVRHEIRTYNDNIIYDVDTSEDTDKPYYKFNINDLRAGAVNIITKYIENPEFSREIAEEILDQGISIPNNRIKYRVLIILNNAVRNCDIDTLFKYRYRTQYGILIPNNDICENERFIEMVGQGIDFPIIPWAVVAVMIKLKVPKQDISNYLSINKLACSPILCQNGYGNVFEGKKICLERYFIMRYMSNYPYQKKMPINIPGNAGDKTGKICFGECIKDWKDSVFMDPVKLARYPDNINWAIIFGEILLGNYKCVYLIKFYHKEYELIKYLIIRWREYKSYIRKFNAEMELIPEDDLEQLLQEKQ